MLKIIGEVNQISFNLDLVLRKFLISASGNYYRASANFIFYGTEPANINI